MQSTTKIYNLQSLNFLRNCRLNVGILGGSFNPAHEGHLNLSYQAFKLLNLDYVIWLVALQNPLKAKYEYDIFERAVNSTTIVDNPRILVSSAEYDIGSFRTYDSLYKLKNLFTNINFTFLMGADNVNNFYKWYRYEDIVKLCKIAVFDRPNVPGYCNFSRFALKLKPSIDQNRACNVMIYRGTMLEMSSSSIREKLKW